MSRHQDYASIKKSVILMMALLNAAILKTAFIGNEKWYGLLWLTVPLLVAAMLYKKGKRNAIKPTVVKARRKGSWLTSRSLPLNQSAPRPVISSEN